MVDVNPAHFAGDPAFTQQLALNPVFIASIVAMLEANYSGISHVGDIKATARATAPTNWLMIDASTVVNGQTIYPNLWAVIPASWKSGANIVLPDGRGRAIVGAGTGSGLTARTLSTLFGAETHQLTAGESGTAVHGHGVSDPTHNHSQNSHNHTQDAHTHPVDGTGTGVVQNGAASLGGANVTVGGAGYALGVNIAQTATNQAATATNVAAGTGLSVTNHAGASAASAHNNVQPSLALNLMVRAA